MAGGENMKIDYWEILKKSLNATWKNRLLWWFGFFITLSGIGGFNYFYGPHNRPGLGRHHARLAFLSQNSHWLTILIIIALLLYVLFIILGIIARGALIKSLESRLKKESVTFADGFSQGRRYFGRIFLIAVLIDLFALASIVVLTAPVAFLFYDGAYVIGTLMGVLAAIILIPLLILAFFLRTYSYLYAVLGDLGFWQAIEKAYLLLEKNILASLIMALIFIPLIFALLIATVMTALPIILVFLGVGLILYLLLGPAGPAAAFSLGIVCFVIAILAIRSAYEVFAQAVWLIFFREIASPKTKQEVEESEPEVSPSTKAMPAIDAQTK